MGTYLVAALVVVVGGVLGTQLTLLATFAVGELNILGGLGR